MIDSSNSYWSSKRKQLERQSKQMTISNLVRKNRLICTRQEYESCVIIARSFKAYKLRKSIKAKIEKRKQYQQYKKTVRRLNNRSVSTGRAGANRGDDSANSRTKKRYDNFKDD